MSSKEIRAGKAVVEGTFRDNMAAGMKAAQARLKAFGASVTAAGTMLAGAGAAGLGMFTSAASAFADFGGDIDDAAQRTGASAEALSALGHAAKMAGSSQEAVNKSFQGMARFSDAAAKGSKNAMDRLKQLGINADDFASADPEKKFMMLAEGISKIEDPTARAAAAMEVFGKSGIEMLPLVANGAEGVAEAMADAASVGAVISTEDAQKAAALGDAWDNLKTAMFGVVMRVGSVVAPAFTAIADAITTAVITVQQFMENNQGLVMGVFYAAAAVTGLGVALIGLGGSIAAALAIASGFVTVCGAIASAVAFILSPLGLIVVAVSAVTAALVGAGAYWLFFSETGQNVLAAIQAAINLTITTLQGLWAAFSMGNWSQVGAIAAAAFQVAWQSALLGVKSLFGDWAQHAISMIKGVMNAMAKFTREMFLGIQETGKALQNVPGMKGAGDAMVLAGAMGVIGTTKAQGAANRGLDSLAKQLAEASPERVLDAVADLTQKAKEATDEAAKAQEERKKNLLGRIPEVGGMATPAATTKSFNTGAFSSFMALQLGRAGGGIEEKQLEVAEEMVDELGEIKDKLSFV